MNQYLNTVGLLLNIVGVILLAIFGVPQPDFTEEVSIGVAKGTVFADGTSAASKEAAARATRILYTRLSRLALGLIVLGFLAQLVAVWIH